MERREFLKITGMSAAAAAVLPRFGSLFAQDSKSSGRNILVVIYARGGMDVLNAIVPHGDKRYYELRPTIAIPQDQVVKLDDMFGLHPALKALQPFWESKKLAPIVSCGSPDNTRSHFDAQDFMEYAAPGIRTMKDGWLNRYLTGTKRKDESPLRAVAMQGLLPRALRGDYPVLAVPEKKVLENEKVLDAFENLYKDEMMERKEDAVVNAGKDTIETLKRYKELVEKHKKERKVAYPSGKLGQKLQDVASVIHADAGLEVAAIDVGGWDDHTNEGAGEGNMARRLKEYADSVAAFAQDLGDTLDRTLILTMTEFGRTCKENGNNGTDHGHGSAMVLLGGKVKGGRVHGKWNGLEDKALYQARDLAASTDFRDIFADVLRNHMGWDPGKEYFPKYKAGEVKNLY